ncbi:glutamate ABC transporter substrate-binding protein [Kineosporia mesophila]|uniref:Glutamate ABC transporter substrate-binding protein n=1 Tax=Kineosporia mesophila TaxID=566012 RepID=A0ABP6Z620_9ACTN|nr:glutamate ABC transporter substrate-binding protein [Kineosporia mesophila]MCD5353944.1 glutamate ABC transporter substrate-binding protein [Kineosporia mesophila]
MKTSTLRSTRRLRTAKVAAVVAVGVLALTACGGGSDSDDDGDAEATQATFEAGTTMETLQKAGKITIGTKFDQPGFGLKGLSGEPEGFDVEIAKIIAEGLGIDDDNITWVETPSAVRETKIEDGEVSLVAATYTINDERKKRITFAGPYYEAGQQVMVRSDDSAITGPESFKTNADLKVCSVAGSTPADNISSYLASKSQLTTFDVYSKCADALRNKQVDAVTTDNVILLGLVGDSDGAFKVVGDTFTKEPYGIGVKKGDTAFCQYIVDTLKKASQDGDYEEAWTETAGKVEGSTVPTLPTADACA